MKDILNKLAALADEADSEGQLDLANGIDGLIKTFAADILTEQLDAQHRETAKSRNVVMPAASVNVEKQTFKDPLEITSRPQAVKALSVKEQHEKARQQMAQIAKLYTDAGRNVPFVVPPAGRTTGQQILDFLEKAGKGGKLSSWDDMFARLKEIQGDAHLFALDMKPDPFGKQDTMIAKNDAASLPPDAMKVKVPGPLEFLPGEVTGKGPPKPPRGM